MQDGAFTGRPAPASEELTDDYGQHLVSPTSGPEGATAVALLGVLLVAACWRGWKDRHTRGPFDDDPR